jgi:phage N-6-adenine-methyltransferase
MEADAGMTTKTTRVNFGTPDRPVLLTADNAAEVALTIGQALLKGRKRNPYGGSRDVVRQGWRTPAALWAVIQERWGPFGIDGAADKDNTLCNAWWGPGSLSREDALSERPWSRERWIGKVFINPPFARTAEFVNRARSEVSGTWDHEALAYTADVVFLIKVATGELWWNWVHEYADSVTFLSPRVNYDPPVGVDRKSGCSFGSAVVVFRRWQVTPGVARYGWLRWRCNTVGVPS